MRMMKVIAMTLTVLAAARPALAENFRSIQSGNWVTATTWEMEDLNEPGKWIAPTHIPGEYDSAEIRHGVAITGNSYINALTVNAGASLAINPQARLYLKRASPAASVTGTLEVKGQLRMEPSSGSASLTLLSSQTLPLCGGTIKGLTTAGPGQLRIPSGITMTNAGTVEGSLNMTGNGGTGGTFRNEGTVTANIEAELLLDSSLGAITDNSAAIWSVNYDSTAAVLRFGKGASGLAGSFQLLQGRGVLRISASIGTPSLRVDQGRIIVDTSQTFTYGTVSGSCSGSVPASPMNAGAYPSVSTFYCYP